MRIQIIIVLLVIITVYCACNSNGNGSVLGKYDNWGEKNAVHYVELNEDSTYIHYYQKEGDSALENKGKWKYYAENKEVGFENWIEFIRRSEDSSNLYNVIVRLRKGELFFSYDLTKEMNFIKQGH